MGDTVIDDTGKENLRAHLKETPELKAWRDYLVDERGFSTSAMDSPEVDAIKALEGYALTALQALQRLPPQFPLEATCDGRCVIWVLGARDHIEKLQILNGGWSRLLTALGAPIDLVLVGPELQPDPMVRSKGRLRLITIRSQLHESWLPKSLSSPTFVLAFNSGIGSSMSHLMMSWLPTLGKLLSLRCPVLLTCFGPPEALVESWTLQALHARYQRHQTGGFWTANYAGADSKHAVGVNNSMFTWVYGCRLPAPQLRDHAVPHVLTQLRGLEFLEFLRAAPFYMEILGSPDAKAISAWRALHNDLFTEAARQSLDIRTILRCVGAAMASACRFDLAACAVAVDLHARNALAGLKQWCNLQLTISGETDAEDREDLAAINAHFAEVQRRLDVAPSLASLIAPNDENVNSVDRDADRCCNEEQPLGATFVIQVDGVQLLSEPSSAACRIAKLEVGEELRVLTRRGMWLRAARLQNLEQEQQTGWLLAYRPRRRWFLAATTESAGGRSVGVVSGWKPADWECWTDFLFA